MTWEDNKAIDDYDERIARGREVAFGWGFNQMGCAFLPRMDVDGLADTFLNGKQEGSVTHYRTADILVHERLRQIAYHPRALVIAAAHLGMMPTVVDVSVWRSKPGEINGAQTWHRDRDDWRACKLFCYLTDVNADHGPHAFVPGSHRSVGPFKHERFFKGNGRSMADVIEQIPHVEIIGQAGTCWIEQTYGFHKGVRPTAGERVMFQACYAQTIYPHMATKARAILEKWGQPA